MTREPVKPPRAAAEYLLAAWDTMGYELCEKERGRLVNDIAILLDAREAEATALLRRALEALEYDEALFGRHQNYQGARSKVIAALRSYLSRGQG